MTRCTRCGGLMHKDLSAQRPWFWLWACWACGDRIDETIWLHRAMQRPESQFERHARIMRELRALVQQGDIRGLILNEGSAR